MKGLVVNELQKVYKQKGYRILFIIFLSLVLVVGAVFSLIMSSIYNSKETAQSVRKDYLEMAKDHSSDFYYSEYYTALADSCNFFIDKNIEDWKYARRNSLAPAGLSDDYDNLYVDKVILQNLIAGNFNIDELVNRWDYETNIHNLFSKSGKYYLDYYYKSYDKEGDYYAGSFVWYVYDETTGEYKVSKTCPLTTADYQNLLDDIKDDIAEYEQAIIDATSDKIIQDSLDSVNLSISDLKSEKNPDQKTLYKIEYMERIANLYQYLIDNTDTFDGDYRFTFVQSYDYRDDYDVWDFFGSSSSLFYQYCQIPYTLEEYQSMNDDATEKDYNKYVKEVEESRATANRALAIVEASVIENKLPEGTDKGTKATFRTSITTVSSYITIILIVIGALSVSSEHSSGTIRLLLIRPKKRWKILVSKYISVLLYDVILHIACAILLFGVSFICGFGDMFRPDVDYVFGSLYSIPAIFTNIKIILLSIISSLPIVTLAFMLSTITFKSPLAIALTFIINYVSSAISSIILLITVSFTNTVPLWYKLTIFPYTNLCNFRTSEELSLIKSSNGIGTIFSLLFSSTSTTDYSLGLWYGIAIVVVHTALFLFLSLINFNKKEIKN